MNKRNRIELSTGIVTVILALVGTVLFFLSYRTGYYTFGQMNSSLIAALVGCGIAAEVAALIIRGKNPTVLWPKLLAFAVTALLVGAAMLLMGDRVEGIGNCIITDYDAGHGGEEAIYRSIAASVLMLAAAVYNIIGSFAADKEDETEKKAPRTGYLVCGISAAAVLAGVLIPTAPLAGFVAGSAAAGAGSAGKNGGSYTVSYNQEAGNTDSMPDYQFLCSDLSGMVKADSRFYLDISLALDGNGTYKLVSDAYVIEAGKRAEIGDDTGLGLVLTTTAEGSYTEDEDGTFTTSEAEHAVFEMKTDTYSSQMKGAAQMSVNGNDADGVYDSNEEPAVLEFVPETIWTTDGKDIISWAKSGEGESVTEAVTEKASEKEGKSLEVISDDEGTTITFNADGTYRFFFEAYGVEDLGTYTYEDGVLTVTNANGDAVTAEGDPLKLHYVTAVSDQLAGDYTVAASDLAALTEGETAEAVPEDASAEEGSLEVISDDGGTTITFNPDGTYRFFFEAYNVEDLGTYTYENGVLTITNANGDEVTAEGDPLKFHYVSAVSDQLAGDYTVAASDLK